MDLLEETLSRIFITLIGLPRMRNTKSINLLITKYYDLHVNTELTYFILVFRSNIKAVRP